MAHQRHAIRITAKFLYVFLEPMKRCTIEDENYYISKEIAATYA